jgi:hypothetical protein
VEGTGEVPTLSKIIQKLQTKNAILGRPLRADLQPKATPAQVAASAKNAIAYFCRRNVDLVVVLIDREDNANAPTFSAALRQAFQSLYPRITIEVVVKDSCVENWLIADPDALKLQKKRFNITPAFVNRVIPNKADLQNAHAMLNDAAIKFNYDKGSDPQKITQLQDPHRVASNSRSFRRFLRVIGDPKYATQSKLP